jgi:hypothetical protein
VAEAGGRRTEHSERGRPCIFKEVMGCGGAHPPWLCRAFGRLPAKEREKLIVANKLCPYCLLHDKEKPCGAKQRPVSVACTIPGCKGRHVQKLHEALKDIFREEGRIHVLQEDDGWGEPDEAWELEEAERMIVGAVRQEDEGSWSEACETWTASDEEAEAGIHQVGAEETETSDVDQEEGLLIEGEEREYILELLLREALPETRTGGQPASIKGEEKKNVGKKPHGKVKVTKEAVAKVSKKSGSETIAKRRGEQALEDLPTNPDTKGGKAAKKDQGTEGQPASPSPTLGRECSA